MADPESPLLGLYLALRNPDDAAAVEAALKNIPDLDEALMMASGLGWPCEDAAVAVALVKALLAAGADATAVDERGRTALHYTTLSWAQDQACVVKALLDAAPEAALMADAGGRVPLHCALADGRYTTARCLLEHGALPPAADVLSALQRRRERDPAMPPSLYATLAARLALTPAQWQRMPSPCPGLEVALPAVLARSQAEAGLLVRRLPASDCERLRTAALCLRRAERVHGVCLPTDVCARIIASGVVVRPPAPRNWSGAGGWMPRVVVTGLTFAVLCSTERSSNTERWLSSALFLFAVHIL